MYVTILMDANYNFATDPRTPSGGVGGTLSLTVVCNESGRQNPGGWCLLSTCG